MRIISGILKGRSINFLKNSNTRPLKDSVKENIFNILKHSSSIKIDLENSKVLDLYSGIGSFGIECISRNALQVTFVEKDSSAVNILRKNLTNLSIIKKTKVHNDSIENFLNTNKDDKFNIIFLDPPFKDKSFKNYLALIKKNMIYEKNHIFIIHREIKTDDELGRMFKTIEIKEYGRSKIIFGEFR